MQSQIGAGDNVIVERRIASTAFDNVIVLPPVNKLTARPWLLLIYREAFQSVSIGYAVLADYGDAG
jgi:hypothetical protein